MKRLLPIAPIAWMLINAAPAIGDPTPPAIGDPQYGWMVSASPVDPCVNAGSFPTGPLSLYLWYVYNADEGIASATMTLQHPPSALDVIAFIPTDGVINTGTPTDLILDIAGCPSAPLLIGHWACVASSTDWEVCIETHSLNFNVNCDPDNPTAFPFVQRGYTNDGTLACMSPFLDQICPPPPHNVNRYGWTVSSSTTDPCVNSGSLPAGSVELHLWYAYNSKDGLYSSYIFPVVSPPGALDIFGFIVMNGFLNAGTPTHLFLAVGGCPNAPILAGTWLAFAATSQWEFCLGGPDNFSEWCGGHPELSPNETRGFANNVPLTCSSPVFDTEVCSPPVSVESASWGSIKALYR